MSESPAATPLTLAIGGDVMLGRLVNDTLARRDPAYVWGDLLPLLSDVDAFFINLECAITTRDIRWHDGHHKPFHFRADPRAVETLRRARVDIASVANNHIADFGLDGLLDTIAVLDQAGIGHAGAGRDLVAARAPAVCAIGGQRIAVVAFADYPRAWAATPALPGLNFTTVSVEESAFAPVAAAIDAARAVADIVIFSIHWGPNMRERPPEQFRQFAHRVIDAGATVFWGHSAHVVQGVEVVPGRGVVLYDIGDLVDDYAISPEFRNDLGAVCLVRLRGRAVEGVELVPTRIEQMQVRRAVGQDRHWFTRRFEALCHELGGSITQGADGALRVESARHVLHGPSEVR
jgi:poly-gamma-glutamate synthesis protein (capsule biosynthesis protein)